MTENGKRKLLIISLIPLFALLALKAPTVGTDTANYMRGYTQIEGMTFQQVRSLDYMEQGFLCFEYLLTRYFHDPQALYIVYGLIVCCSLYFFINETAQQKCLCLLLIVTLGYFQFAMSGLRQTIAMSILLIAYRFIKDRKIIKFLLMALLAMQFHKSAVLFIPAYFVANLHITRKNIGLMMAGVLILFFFAEKLFLTAAEMMEYKYGIEETGNGYIFFTIVLLITILCLRNRHRLLAFNPRNLIAININFLSLALWCLRLVSRTAERVSFYYLPYTCLALEEYLTTAPKEERNIYTSVTVLLSVFFFFFRLSGNPYLNQFTFCF